MDKYKIRYTAAAIEDLQGIGHYILFEEQDSTIAKNLINTICEEIGKLDQMPRRFQIIEASPWKERDTHRMIVKNHVVIYQIDEENMIVYISRVLSCRQDINKIKC